MMLRVDDPGFKEQATIEKACLSSFEELLEILHNSDAWRLTLPV